MNTPYQEPLGPQSQVEPALIPLLTHELRTPLTAIKGFTSLLLRYQQRFSPHEQRELLEEIALGCERLEGAVAHAVAICEIAADTKMLTATVVDLAHLIRTVLAQSSQDMNHVVASRWQYHVSIVSEGIVPIVGDARELAHVLMFLLDLIRQSSPDGGTFSLAVQPWHSTTALMNIMANKPYWEIQVRDFGSEALTDSLQRLFHYHSGDDLDLVHHSTSSLLGLLYCKRIVTLHGGQIWADHQPAYGTTLHLILPADDCEGNESNHARGVSGS